MPKGKPSQQQLAEIRAFAAEWGKIVARRLGLEEAGSLDFAAMEQVAAAAAAGLTEGTLSVLLDQQARSLGAEHPCPGCGRACVIGHEDRTLTVKGAGLPRCSMAVQYFALGMWLKKPVFSQVSNYGHNVACEDANISSQWMFAINHYTNSSYDHLGSPGSKGAPRFPCTNRSATVPAVAGTFSTLLAGRDRCRGDRRGA